MGRGVGGGGGGPEPSRPEWGEGVRGRELHTLHMLTGGWQRPRCAASLPFLTDPRPFLTCEWPLGFSLVWIFKWTVCLWLRVLLAHCVPPPCVLLNNPIFRIVFRRLGWPLRPCMCLVPTC